MQLLCDPMDCSPPGSFAHGVFQARILWWVSIPSSGGSSRPRNQTHISCIYCTGRQMLYHWESRLVEGGIFRDWYESDEYPKKIGNWGCLREENSSCKVCNTQHTQRLLWDAHVFLPSLLSDEDSVSLNFLVLSTPSLILPPEEGRRCQDAGLESLPLSGWRCQDAGLESLSLPG